MNTESLNSKLNALAMTFTNNLLNELCNASFDEIAAVQGGTVPVKKRASKTESGRLPRRSVEELDVVVKKVAGVLAKHKDGMRSEALQEALKLSKKEIVGPLSRGVATKVLKKMGNKRATTYFVGGKASKPTKVKSVKAKPNRTAKKTVKR